MRCIMLGEETLLPPSIPALFLATSEPTVVSAVFAGETLLATECLLAIHGRHGGRPLITARTADSRIRRTAGCPGPLTRTVYGCQSDS